MYQCSNVGRHVLLGAVFIVAASLTVPPVIVKAQQRRESDTTVEALAAKVKRFEDMQQIADLLNEYGRALDTRDFKAYGSLFAKTARGRVAWARSRADRKRSTTS